MPSGIWYFRAAAEISRSQMPVEASTSEIEIASVGIAAASARIAEDRRRVIACPIVLVRVAAGAFIALAGVVALAALLQVLATARLGLIAIVLAAAALAGIGASRGAQLDRHLID